INNEGLSKLSMRNVANLLNTSATALYWHVKNKNDLLQLISEEIVKKISFPNSKNSWYEQLFELAKNYRRALLSVRDSTAIMLVTPPITPYRLQIIEYIFEL